MIKKKSKNLSRLKEIILTLRKYHLHRGLHRKSYMEYWKI